MAASTRECPHCNGVGSIVVSLCCGRGCLTCVGDQLQAVECFSCKGSGSAEARDALREPVDTRDVDSELPR